MASLRQANDLSPPVSALHVTAAEITRNFGMWQDRAALNPVIVTHHGRARCVLLSASSYHQLARSTGPETSTGQDGLLMQVLAERIDLAFLVIDERLCVREANTAAAILLGAQRELLLGRPLDQLWPDFEDSVAEAHIRRAMRANETAQVRLRVDGATLSINAFPWPGGLGLLIRAAGGEEQRDHAIAEAGAIHRLLMLDRQLGTVKLSTRGTISEPDPGFCAMTGIPAERLTGARFIDLVSRNGRAGLSGIIEQAFAGSDEGQGDAVLINNDGLEVPVRFAITAIRDDLGMTGAMVMVRDRRGGAHAQGDLQ